MKRIIFCLGLFLGTTALAATAKAQNQPLAQVAVTFNKTSQPASTQSYSISDKGLGTVVAQRLNKENLGKAKSASDKFKMFKGVTWTAISPDAMDYYYRVSGNKNKATLEILVSKGYDNFVSAQSDPQIVQKVYQFMNSLNEDIARYHLEANIQDKTKEVAKAQKELKKKAGTVERAERELKKAQQEFDKQQQLIDKMKEEIEALKGKS